MACPELDDVIEKFNSFTEKPVKFLAVQNEVKDDIKSLVKSLYDFTKTQDNDVKKSKKGALPELIVQDLDEEQIWQEIELQNNACWDDLVWEVANCMTLKNDLVFPVDTDERPDNLADSDDENLADPEEDFDDSKASGLDHEGNSDDADSDENLSDEEMVDEEETLKPKNILKPAKVKPSIVDDQFFKLQEMEQFLLKEEKTDGSNKKVSEDSDEESIDLFEDIEDDDEEGDEENEGGNDVMYSDFFEQDNRDDYDQQDKEDESENDMEDIENEDRNEPSKKDKKVRFAQPMSSDDESIPSDVENKQSDEKKSEFERRQDRLKETIDRLEKKTLNDAPWQLKGEIDATKRPENSLLEEVVDFDLTTRPAPIITEETTLTLEDIIRQRIKDKAWDDVVKKEKPVDDQLNFRKTEILDQSKSKLSLAQVYEAEYLKQKQATNGDVEEEKEPESHKEIRESMSQLFSKLNALCHYHYTPKPAQAEVKIVSNTPAISMEEVAPVSMSDAALLAPEEVKKKQRGDLMSKEERTDTDKKRERRKKKKLQKAKGPVTKVTDNRNTSKGNEADDKSLKTSKAFFQQLNDDTTSTIKNGKNKSVKKLNKKG